MQTEVAARTVEPGGYLTAYASEITVDWRRASNPDKLGLGAPRADAERAEEAAGDELVPGSSKAPAVRHECVGIGRVGP
jgi:hypothetical protein